MDGLLIMRIMSMLAFWVDSMAKSSSEKSDWEKYSELSDDDDILTTDYEHKQFLLKQRIKKDIKNPEDMLTKELQTSFIDRNIAFIYSIKMTAAEGWRNVGYPQIAKRRMVHLLIRLGLLRSVDGFERILQTAATSAQLDVTSQQLALQQKQTDEKDNMLSQIWEKLVKK